jgi:hypothetical protein
MGCLVYIIYTGGDLQNMVRSIGMLLDQMKQLNEDTALRAPDRCEGVLNSRWQWLQHVTTTETEQDKIAMFWKVQIVTDVQQYLHVGGLGSRPKLTYRSGRNHTPVDSISFCFGFYLTSTRNEGESIWKSTRIGEGDLTREFCFLFLSFVHVFCFLFKQNTCTNNVFCFLFKLFF